MLRHRLLTLILTGAFVVAASLLIARGGPLASGTVAGTETEATQDLLEEVTGHPEDATFAVVMVPREPLDAAALADEARRALEPLRADPRVAAVADQPVPPRPGPPLRIAYVTVQGTPADAIAAYPELRARLASGTLDISCTGHAPFVHDLNQTLEHDLVRAELIAMPLALLVLLLVFETLIAAALPVVVGGLAVLGGIGVVLGLSHVMSVAMYTINVCSLVGLGVAIDYSLFLVSRYREERRAGHATDEAIVRTMDTTGRTIAYSAVAVCAGLAGLLFFTGSYLFTMGLGGIIVVSFALLFALTLVPALLSLLGDAIFKLKLLPARRGDSVVWSKIARAVMKRPILFGAPALALLLVLGVPFLHLHAAAANVTVLGPEVEARRGYDIMKRTMPELGATRIVVAVDFPLTSDAHARAQALGGLAARIRAIPDVRAIEPPPMAARPPALAGNIAILHVLTDRAPETEDARAIVRAIRADRNVGEGTLLVGGEPARDVDLVDYVRARAPAAIAFVVAATLVLLFLSLRSVLLPIKAVIMNALSMTASFGAIVWIFQDGHLGVREPRPLEPTLPILLFCVLFGLSMDYEILLLSRIRESYERHRDNTEAVCDGLWRSGALITSAAAIMAAVFFAFAFASVVTMRAVGVGMALAVVLDATLVRTIVVPAAMRLFGDLNWWAPSWPFHRKTPPAPPLPHEPEAHRA